MRSFSVSTASPAVTLDRGRARAVFTVSNVAPQPVRGRLVVTPLPPTPAAWVSLDGDGERDFATNETQQAGVKIAVPPGAAVDVYPFRLNVYSVVNPEDDFAEGPVVSFTVSTPPPPRKLPPWLIPVAAAAAAAVVAVVIAVLATGRPNTKPSGDDAEVALPDFTGTPASEAEATITSLGLRFVETGDAPAKEAKDFGAVMSQVPQGSKPGRVAVTIRKGETVDLVIYERGLEVPPLKGKQWSPDMDQVLAERHIPVKKNATDGTAGLIRDQDPEPPARISKRAVLQLYIGGVEVPSVMGKTRLEIAQLQAQVGSDLKLETDPNDPVAVGGSGISPIVLQHFKVRKAVPDQGSWVKRGATVTLTYRP